MSSQQDLQRIAGVPENLQRIASRPENRVLQWAQPGDRREGAFGAVQLSSILEALKLAVVEAASSRAGQNELMVRWQLSRQQVPGAPEGYTWASFAEHYPTFWGRLTSASATRKDVISIHTMVDARRRYEAGDLASEQEVESLIQNDLLALNMDEARRGGKGGSAGSGPGSDGAAAAAAAGAGNGPEVRQLLQQARLRRTVLERRFGGAMVPAEELKRRGVSYSPSQSCLHSIREEEERLAAALAKPGSRQSQERKRQVAALERYEVTFGRSLLQLRAAIAKRCLGLPEALDPKGASFMPTYTRSAQSDLAWASGAGAEDWVRVPRELALQEEAEMAA